MRNDDVREFYQRALSALWASSFPSMVGGAYALGVHTGIHRETRDLDIFIRPTDVARAVQLFEELGYPSRIVAHHWLAKVTLQGMVIDFVSGFRNGVAQVDDSWMRESSRGLLFGTPVRILSPELLIWSKSFVMERDRYDGADIAHVIHAKGRTLDWPGLLARFGPHWPVLLSHLLLFRYTFPSDRDRVPEGLLYDLLGRQARGGEPIPSANGKPVCRGTLFSHTQYAHDVETLGYHDARLSPLGPLTSENILE
jgi:hypothetical protein